MKNAIELTQAEKNAVISSCIITLVAGGMTLREAMDALLGEGTYLSLANSIYDSLRAKEAA